MLFAAGCGGGGGTVLEPSGGSTTTPVVPTPTPTVAGGAIALTGEVAKGPLRAAALRVHARTSTLADGETRGSGTTDAQGRFALTVPGWDGPAYLRASGGTFVDEATGATLTYGQALTGLLPHVAPGQAYNVRITPLTHFAVKRAEALGAFDAATLDRVLGEISQVFGNLDVGGTSPANPLSPGSADGHAGDYGLVLGAVSRLAQTLNVAPDVLIDALARDLADGVVDGRAGGQPLLVGTTDLSARPLSEQLVSSLLLFAYSGRNVRGLVPSENLLRTLGAIDGALPDGTLPVADPGGDQDVDAGATVRLAGSARGVTGTPGFRWTQVSGPAVTLSAATSPNPSFVASQEGVCLFELVVTDNGRASRPARVRCGVRASGARLAVRAVAATPRFLSRGQQFLVEVGVQNLGRRTARIGSVAPRFLSGGQDVSAEYTATPATNPSRIAPGATASFAFAVTASAGATLGDVAVDAAVAGTDAVDGAAVADSGADVTALVTMQTAAQVVVESITAPPQAEMGKTADVSVVLRNDGQARALLTGLTLSFRDGGGVDRTGQYTVTPASGNPSLLNPGQRVTLSFTVAIARLATAGNVTIDASVAFRDLNSGVSGSRAGAVAPATWTVVIPKVVFIDAVTGPASVSRGQTALVNVQVTNGTSDVAALVSTTLSFRQGSLDVSSGFSMTPVAGNATSLAVGETRTLQFSVGVGASAPAGAVVVDASVRFTANGATRTEPGAASPLTWTVVTPATLSLGAVSAPTLVSRGQAVTVTVPVTNGGGASLGGISVTPTFRSAGGADVSADYSVAPSPANPAVLSGGQTATFSFTVTVRPTAALALAVIDAVASGVDANSGAALSDPAAASSGSWVVQIPGSLALPSVVADRAVISQSQTFNVTMNVQNTGGARVTLTAATSRPSFTNGSGIDRASSYLVSADAANPTFLNGGATATLHFTIVASPSAPPELVTVGGVVEGVDANTGAFITSGPAIATHALTVQARAVLDILSTTAPAVVVAGTTVPVTMTVRNQGGVVANILSNNLVFLQGAANRSSDYLVTRVTAPATVAGGATVDYVYSVLVRATATPGLTTIDGSIFGTDANSNVLTSDTSAATRATWNFATPASLSITSVTGPASVTLGQTFTVTMTVAATGSPVSLTASSLTLRQGATDRTGEYTITPSGANPTLVNPGTPASLVFTVSGGTTPGATTVDGSVSGTDTVFGGAASDTGATTPLALAVQTPPALTVTSVAVPPLVSQGQTATVTVTVANAGGATATFAGTTLSFTGTAPRDGEYTVSPAAGNPASVAGGASAQLRFDIVVAPLATREAVAVRATVNASDANTGAPVSANGPAVPQSWTVQTGATLAITAITSATTVASQGQTFGVSVSMANSGDAAARVNATGLTFMLGAADRSAEYTVSAAGGNPTQVAGSSTASFGFNVTVGAAAAPGTIDVTGRVTGTDVNSNGTVIGTGPALPLAFTLQRRATLSVVSVAGPASISQGQTTHVTVTVTNTGDAAANGVSTALAMATGGTNRTAEYTRTLVSGPASISGNATATYVWQVVAGANATTGAGTVDASATGTDANSGLTTSDASATTPASWTVLPSARLSILSIDPPAASARRVTQGQTFDVTMNVRNTGGNPATFTAPVTLSFRTGAVDHTAEYTATPRGTNAAGVAPGVTVPLVFDVGTSGATVPATAAINGTVTATDDVVGVTVNTTSAVVQGQVIVQTPPALSVQTLTLPPFVSIGHAFNATAAVRNSGASAATANVTAVALDLRALDTSDLTPQFTLTPIAPVTVTGNQTRNITVRVTATNALSPQQVDATAQASGTDANSGALASATGPVTPTRFALQTPAALTVLSVSTPRATVSQGQTATLTAVVQNGGQGAADTFAFSFSVLQGATPRTPEYTITPRAGNPTTLAGGATAAFTFNAVVSPAASTGGPMTIDVATVTARDVNSTDAISDAGSNITTAWTVQRPAGLRIASVAVTPAEAFQSESLFVTLLANNTGEATANVSSATVTFTTSGVDDTATYIQTPDPGNPNQITGNTTATLRFTISSTIDTQVGVTRLDGDMVILDDNSGAAVQDTSADVTATATIKPFDTVGPKLLYTNPSNGAHNVQTSTALFVTFDRPMDPSTVLASSFTLAKQGTPVTTQPITSAVRLFPDRQTWQLVVPAASFTPVSTYAVIVSNRVKDISGNPCQGDGFTFSTTLQPESLGASPPTSRTTQPLIFGSFLKWTSPAHTQYNVPDSSIVQVRWPQVIDPTTVNTNSVRFWRLSTPAIELSVASVTAATQPTATFLIAPSQPLSLDTTYGVFVTNNVREPSGMPVNTQDVFWSTTVVAEQSGRQSIRVSDEGPIFRETNPSHDRFNVMSSSRILVTLNEAARPGSLSAGNFRVWEQRPVTDQAPLTLANTVTSLTPMSSPPNSVQLNLSAPLTFGSTYVVAMDNRVIDTAGNHAVVEDFDFHCVINDTRFTNLDGRAGEPVPDEIGPSFRSIGLNLFSDSNAFCTPIRMQFTENVSPSALTPNTNVRLFRRVIPSGGEPGPWTAVTISTITTDASQPNTYFVTPTTALSVSGTTVFQHALFVNNRVQDAPGNSSPGESASFHYNNGSGCCNPAVGCCCGIAIQAVSPSHLKLNVTPNTRVLVQFNQPVLASTVATNVRLFESAFLDEVIGCSQTPDFPQINVPVTCNVTQLAAPANTFEFVPVAPLKSDQTYAIIQTGGNLLKADGTFMPCGTTLNYSVFSTTNFTIPRVGGSPPSPPVPDELSMHNQFPQGSEASLAGTTIVASIPGIARYNHRGSTRLFVTLDPTISPVSVDTRALQVQEWILPAPLPVTITAVLPTGRPNEWEIIPQAPLSERTTYSMHLTNWATQVGTGLPACPDEVWFSTSVDKDRMDVVAPLAVQPAPDLVGPAVLSISPRRKANVHPANRVVVQFDETMRASTVTTATTNFIVVSRDIDQVLTQGYADVTRSVTATPFGTPPETYIISTPLSAPTTYGVFFTDNLRDAAGNPAEGQAEWFETRTDFATFGRTVPSELTTLTAFVGPFVRTANPSNGRTSALTESRILLSMTEPVSASVMANGVFMKQLLPGPEANVTVTVVPVAQPPNSFEVVPSVPLAENTTYGVYVTNLVHDAAGQFSPTDEFYFQTQTVQASVGSQTPATLVTDVNSGPTWAGTNPVNLRFNLQPTTHLFVTFNRPVGSLADPRSVVVAELTTPTITRIPISGPITAVSTPANTYEIPILAASLSRGTTYGVFLTNRVTDTNGFPSPGDSFQFSTSIDFASMGNTVPATHRASAALVGPMLARQSPTNAKVNVSRDTRILFTYNTTVTGVDGASVQFLEIPAAPSPVVSLPGNVVAGTAPNSFEFVPSAPLNLETTYALCLTNGVRDTSGRHSRGDEFYFSTKVDAPSAFSTYPTTSRTDVALGPVLIASNPSNGRMNVAATTRILFTFNQPMNDASLNTGQSVTLVNATTPVAIVPTLSVLPVAGGAPNTYELNLAPGSLTDATTYVVQVNNRAESLTGEPCPGDEFSFSTSILKSSIGGTVPATERADVARHGLVLLSSNPENDARNVLPVERILFTFNTTVNAATVTGPGAVVFKQIEPLPETILAGTVSAISTPDNSFEFVPSSAMSIDTTYAVLITNRVQTPAGEPCRGDEFHFSTATSVGATNLGTGSFSCNPAHNRVNVMDNTRVRIAFAQPMDLASLQSSGVQFGPLTTTTFTPDNGITVTAAPAPANAFDVQPSAPLSQNTTYAVFITNLAQTAAGAPSARFYSNFGTQIVTSRMGTETTTAQRLIPDLVGPLPTEFNPPHQRHNQIQDTRVFVTFNTTVSNVDPASVQLRDVAAPVPPVSVTALVPVTSPPHTFELLLSAPLSPDTTYGIFVTNRVETSGQLPSPGDEAFFSTSIVDQSVGSEAYTTTTTSPDRTGPFLFLTNPNHDDFNVDLRSRILVTFNESIVDSSITSSPDRSVQLLRLSPPVADLGPVTVTRASTPANTYEIRTSPPVDLSPETTYAVLVSNNVEDVLGNHAQPGSFRFSTTILFGGGFGFATSLNKAFVATAQLGAGGSNAFPALLVTQLLLSDQLIAGRKTAAMMTVKNPSDMPIAVTQVTLGFNGRDGDFTVSPAASNPATVPGGKTVALGVDLQPRAGATGPVQVTGRVAGTDTRLGFKVQGASDPRGAQIVSPAALAAALAAPAAVSPGHIVDVVLALTNSGERPARVESARFEPGEGYEVVRVTDLPATLDAGGHLSIAFRVRVGAPASWSTALRATATAVDAGTGEPVPVAPHPYAAWAVSPGAGAASLAADSVAGLATDGRRVYVTDTAGSRVLVFARPPSADDTPLFVLGGFASPTGIACDGARLAVADTGRNRVLIWDALPTGPGDEPDRVIGQTSMAGAEAASGVAGLASPQAIALAAGRLVVADTGNRRVQVFPAAPPLAGALADATLLANVDVTALAWDGALWVAEGRRVLGFASLDAGPSLELAVNGAPAGLWAGGGLLLVSDREARAVRAWTRDPAAPLAAPRGGQAVSSGPLGDPGAVLLAPDRLLVAANGRLVIFGR